MHTQPAPRSWRIPLLLASATATLLVGAAIGAAATTFSDVPDTHPHAPGISFVADTGITLGCGGDRYCPTSPVTRAQMATFMHRLSGTAPGTAASVNAATLDGQTAEQLLAGVLARLDTLEDTVAAQDATIASQGAAIANQGARIVALEGALDEVSGTVASLEEQLDTATTALAAAEARLDGYDTLLAGVSRVQVHGQDTIRFAGLNVQIVNGTGGTDTANGTGNLLVGYDAPRSVGSDKSGSHYLVVGDEHNYTRWGGIVAGLYNTATGEWASVTSGAENTASGLYATVSGGRGNIASDTYASVSGGFFNTASGSEASVSGGAGNTASGPGASVSGGFGNTASVNYASVSGGSSNTATGWNSSILGGFSRIVSEEYEMYPPAP